MQLQNKTSIQNEGKPKSTHKHEKETQRLAPAFTDILKTKPAKPLPLPKTSIQFQEHQDQLGSTAMIHSRRIAEPLKTIIALPEEKLKSKKLSYEGT